VTVVVRVVAAVMSELPSLAKPARSDTEGRAEPGVRREDLSMPVASGIGAGTASGA
jgi:hypothetical protein